MIDPSSLASLMASLQSVGWSGQVFRVMLNDYPPDRENTRGARWNPPDVPAIYTCLEVRVCIAEVEYGLARQPRPVRPGLRKTLYRIEVTLSNAVDLESLLPDLKALGIDAAQLFGDDMRVSQEIGRLATWLGFDGLFVPSARSTGKNLVIYTGRTSDSYRYEVIEQKSL
jgi:RES domain-containing protein